MMPEPRPPRRFTLLDAMVLVAAAAVGLAMAREHARWEDPGLAYRVPVIGMFPRLAPATRGVVLGWPVVAMETLALILLRLRRPRPIGRRLFAPPGVAACIIAAVMLALMLVTEAANATDYLLRYPTLFPRGRILETMVHKMLGGVVSPSIGSAVAASWVAMALARRWRPEPSWIDRAGRALGWLWIGLILLRFHLGTNAHLNLTGA